MHTPKPFLQQIIATIDRIPAKRATKFIAIDGRSGSGKSSLAEDLKRLNSNYQIVSLDDFPCRESEHPFHALGTQTMVNWQRVLHDVIAPLSSGRDSSYKKTAWWYSAKPDPEPEVNVYSGGMTLLEGLTSLRKELRPYLDCMIWMECPVACASRRAMLRDGGYEKNRRFWEEVYVPYENIYIAEHSPKEVADLVIFST